MSKVKIRISTIRDKAQKIIEILELDNMIEIKGDTSNNFKITLDEKEKKYFFDITIYLILLALFKKTRNDILSKKIDNFYDEKFYGSIKSNLKNNNKKLIQKISSGIKDKDKKRLFNKKPYSKKHFLFAIKYNGIKIKHIKTLEKYGLGIEIGIYDSIYKIFLHKIDERH